MSLTEKQQQIRRGRCTASTLPAFLGYSAYNAPLHAWKAHVQGSLHANEYTQAGNVLEAGIAELAARQIGIDPARLEPGTTLVHQTEPWLAATPDFLIPDLPMSGIQVKNHGPHMSHTYPSRPRERGRWDNGLVPLEYELQCQIEMMVVGSVYQAPPLEWFLASFFGGATPRVYRIRRDERLQAAMLAAGKQFWLWHIDPAGPREEPDPNRWPWRRMHLANVAPKSRSIKNREELLSAPLPELPMDELALAPPKLEDVS